MKTRTHRRGKINGLAVVLILGAFVAMVFVQRFGPYYWDYWKMKEVTKTAALHWKVYSQKAAVEKLEHMMSAKQFGDDYIEPGFCSWEDFKSEVRVSCYWEVDVEYPFSDKVHTLVFTTEHVESITGS
jgi:hypothetical protein